MNPDALRQLLADVASGALTIDSAHARLRKLPFEQLASATVDHHRAIRCGHPEVIFCQGKTVQQVLAIAQSLVASGQHVLATRASDEQIAALRAAHENVIVSEPGRAVLINAPPTPEASADARPVVVISAGTSDAPVAEEAAMTLRSMRVPTVRLTDVGVSGLHRLLAQAEVLQRACAVVVIAGMEGALPSVVGGLVACPVFAVPTSVGYGASFGGLAALLGMLNSCASAVSVVNTDNGYGAAYSAGLVYQQVQRSVARALLP